jgi:integrase
MHGLRKTAAKTLVEVGCTAHEIMAVTGHKSLAEVERYTRAANQKRMASAAIHRLEQNRN